MTSVATRQQRHDEKHIKKRLKTSKHSKSSKNFPVGSVSGVRRGKNDKDNEERYLESVLFGVPYVPETVNDRLDLEEVSKIDVAGSGLEHVMDQDVRRCA